MLQHFEASVELTLETLHGGSGDGLTAWRLGQLLQTILSTDQETQPALVVIDVESPQHLQPAHLNAVRSSGGTGRLIHQAGPLSPSVDDCGNSAGKRRPGMYAADRHDLARQQCTT